MPDLRNGPVMRYILGAVLVFNGFLFAAIADSMARNGANIFVECFTGLAGLVMLCVGWCNILFGDDVK